MIGSTSKLWCTLEVRIHDSWELGPCKEKWALLMQFPPQRDIDWDYITISQRLHWNFWNFTNWRVTFLLFFKILFGDAVQKGVQTTSFLAHHWKTTAWTNSSIWFRQNNDPMWFVKLGSLVNQCNCFFGCISSRLEGHTSPQTKMKPPLHAAPPAGGTQWSKGDGSGLWGTEHLCKGNILEHNEI